MVRRYDIATDQYVDVTQEDWDIMWLQAQAYGRLRHILLGRAAEVHDETMDFIARARAGVDPSPTSANVSEHFLMPLDGSGNRTAQ